MKTLYLNPKNGLLAYPDDWVPMYNGSTEPCDMLVGPCSCGAWHQPDDTHVEDALKENNAKISNRLDPAYIDEVVNAIKSSRGYKLKAVYSILTRMADAFGFEFSELKIKATYDN